MTRGSEHRRIGRTGAPVLIVSSPRETQGTVLLYHGLGASKQTNLPELQELADAGFVAVGVDAVGHGERRYEDYARRFPAPGSEQSARSFYEVVEQTTAEVPAVIDGLIDAGITDGRHLGIAGISMGGYITFGAPLVERRLAAAAVLIGSPFWRLCGDRSPHLHPERFAPLPLLIVTAEKDSKVPPHHARDFHRRLLPYYDMVPGRLCYEELTGAEHIMGDADWRRATAAMVEWLARHLV